MGSIIFYEVQPKTLTPLALDLIASKDIVVGRRDGQQFLLFSPSRNFELHELTYDEEVMLTIYEYS